MTEIKELRKFGLTLAGLIVLIWGIAIPFLKSREISKWPYIITAIIITTALFTPKVLNPLLKFWGLLSDVLGYINSRIILTIVYSLVLLPLAIISRMFNHHYLDLSLEKSMLSYRKKSIDEHSLINNMERPF